MRKFESAGDRLMAHLANHADLDGRIVMVKHRKSGFIVVFKVDKEDVERIKPRLTAELRFFASQNSISYLTQKVEVRSSEFLVVQIIADEDESTENDNAA